MYLPTNFVTIADKSDKKNIKRFYKVNNYSASFMGYDTCYLIKKDGEIIASAIVSYLIQDHSQTLLHGVFVNKKYRNKQLATQLIQQAKQEHKSIVCFVDKPLASFYQKLNFQPIPSPIMETTNDKSISTSISLSCTLLTRFKQYKQQCPDLKAYIYHLQ